MSIATKIKDPSTGELVDGKVVKVVKAEEPFSYITLEDGSEIMIRVSVLKVIRQIGAWDDNGNPKYTIDVNNSISITSPEKLRKKK